MTIEEELQSMYIPQVGSQITYEYRYEGDGNAFTFYDRMFLTRNDGKEYRNIDMQSVKAMSC